MDSPILTGNQILYETGKNQSIGIPFGRDRTYSCEKPETDGTPENKTKQRIGRMTGMNSQTSQEERKQCKISEIKSFHNTYHCQYIFPLYKGIIKKM